MHALAKGTAALFAARAIAIELALCEALRHSSQEALEIRPPLARLRFPVRRKQIIHHKMEGLLVPLDCRFPRIKKKRRKTDSRCIEIIKEKESSGKRRKAPRPCSPRDRSGEAD